MAYKLVAPQSGEAAVCGLESTLRTRSTICCGQAPLGQAAFAPRPMARQRDAIAIARGNRAGLIAPQRRGSTGSAGAGGTSGACVKRNTKLLAQAAGQIGDHAEAIGHRRRDFAAAEGQL